MANLCEHGFPAGQCRICSTLRAGTAQAPGRSPAAQSPGGGLVPATSPRGWRHPGAPDPPDDRRPEGRSITTHVALVVVGILAIAAIAWLLAGAVFAILHLLELVVVAGIAGWAGYRLGHFRGRRAPR